MPVIFVLGILAIALEDKIKINKAAIALFMAISLWMILMFDAYDIFSYAHVRNGAAEAGLDQGSNALSKERIIEIDPDVFLLPTWNFDSNNDVQKYAQQVAADPAFKNIKAIKNNRLEFVSDRYRYVASQHVTDSIEAVAKVVYPELFAKGE